MGNWMSGRGQREFEGSRSAKGRTLSLSPSRGRVTKAKYKVPRRAKSVPSAMHG